MTGLYHSLPYGLKSTVISVMARLKVKQKYGKYFQEYFDQATGSNDKKEIATALDIMGKIKQFQGDFQAALSSHTKALHSFKELKPDILPNIPNQGVHI